MKKIISYALLSLVAFSGVCLIPNTTYEEITLSDVELSDPSPITGRLIPVVEADESVVLNPALKRVCSCESTGNPDNEPRHLDSNGNVLKGVENPLDTGMCQINLKYHGETAKKMSLDLFSKSGNIAFANWLYDQQGFTPWLWSKKCWE